MKILMIAPTPFFAHRGCHVRIYEEARSLERLGHKVRICTYHNGDDVPGLAIERTPHLPWYRKLEAGPSVHKLYMDILLLLEAFKTLRKFEPDIIHAHLHEGAFIAWIVRLISGKPFIFDYQGSLSEEMAAHGFIRPGGFIYSAARHLERLIERNAKHIIVSSTAAAEKLKYSHRGNGLGVDIVADGVDTDTFKRNGGAEIRRSYGIPADAPVIVYLGLLDEYQGTPHLLRSMKHVFELVPDARLLLGGYPNEAKYREMAQVLGIAQRVILTGRINYFDAPGFLSSGDIAVAPKLSATEANGKLLNYMACSLPCVCFDSANNRSLLGDSGVYVKPGDERALADAIVGLIADRALAKKLADATRRRAVNKCAWNKRAAEIAELYETVLNGHA